MIVRAYDDLPLKVPLHDVVDHELNTGIGGHAEHVRQIASPQRGRTLPGVYAQEHGGDLSQLEGLVCHLCGRQFKVIF